MPRCVSLTEQVRWYVLEPGDGTSYQFGILLIPHELGLAIISGCPGDSYAMLIPASPGVVFDAPLIALRNWPPSADMFNRNDVQVCTSNNRWTMNVIAGIWPVLMADTTDAAVLERAQDVVARMRAGEEFLS